MSEWVSDMSDAERETREALAIYKKVLIESHQPSFWDVLGLIFGSAQARAKKQQVEAELARAREIAVSIVNKTDEHRLWVRNIVAGQPDDVAAADGFLALLNDISNKGAE